MSAALYERYKAALRRGHLAARRGRPDAALAAYGEAASIVSDRALPHVGMGDALRLLRRYEEALAAYGKALGCSAADEGALAGRAETFVALGRRADAAESLDRLADVQEAAGRPGDALSSTLRALELAESKSRRRRIRRLGGTDPDARAAGSRPYVPEIPGPILSEGAEALLDAGDMPRALDGFRAAVAAHRYEGHTAAALDACYLALGIAPDDADLHLMLVELYLERGWRAPAVEKLILLARLADLDGNSSVRERLCRLAATSLADEPRLASICA
jgi:tetratricopeptide (TPR) repeat protein